MADKRSQEARAEELYAAACRVMPGGVNSSVRLHRALGRPVYAARSEGACFWDVEGVRRIDMCCGHGAALLGHGHPAVKQALTLAAELGFLPVFETPYHLELASRVCAHVPCAQRVRFCSSGSEATLHLIRACRAYTGRKKIRRMEGHCHGYHALIYIGGQPPAERWARNRLEPFVESPGIPEELAKLIVPIPYNDEQALEQAIREHGQDTALLILEPVNYNCAGIQPRPGYLERVRSLTREAGILLFFDEIQSAFKRSPGGAQTDFGVTPDVCVIGKAIGGGLPLSAFCGRAEVMDLYRPRGPVQHSGTFNAHLVPVLAGLAFMREVEQPGFYAHPRELERRFHAGLEGIIARLDLNMVAPHHGPRFNILLGRRTPAQRYEDTFCHDSERMLRIYRGCWERGVYFHDYGGGPLHHGYSIQHTAEHLDTVLNVLQDVLSEMREELRA